MARKIIGTSFKMRDTFTLFDKPKLQWFPGHMKKGIDQIQSTLHDIDAVIEVHDARIPFSGRNNQLRDVINIRPHVLILNKIDLADMSRKDEIRAKLTQQGINNIQFTQCLGHNIVKKVQKTIVPLLLNEIQGKPRFRPASFNDYNILVIGVPNVGKSTILNKFRQAYMTKRKAAHVGAMPGITRSVMNRVRVNYDPNIFVVDTPGILSPKIGNDETGMRLALCDCVPNSLVGEELIVDYLLYWLNKRKNFNYVKYYDLKEPTDSYLDFLSEVALKRRLVVPMKDVKQTEIKYRIDFEKAAKIVVKEFQAGHLGSVMFDDDYLDK